MVLLPSVGCAENRAVDGPAQRGRRSIGMDFGVGQKHVGSVFILGNGVLSILGLDRNILVLWLQ